MANTFVPISQLPAYPGGLTVGAVFPVQEAGVTYKVDARQMPLNTDPFLVWQAQADLQNGRVVTAGTGIALNSTTPNVLVIEALNNGTVTSVGLAAPTGFDVTGSPVTGSGTLTIGYTAGYRGFTVAEGNLIASALQPGDNISDLVNDAGYITGISGADVVTALGYTPYDAANPAGYTAGAEWGVNLTSVPAVVTSLGSLANASGSLTNDGSGNLSWVPTGGTGTVTSVGASVPTGLVVTGSPVTTSGTLAIAYDTGYQGFTSAEAALISTALQPSAIGGSNTQVQYNNAGAFGGSAAFTFNSGTGVVSATGFAGSGAGLTNIPDSALTSNVALKNASNQFTVVQQFQAANQVIVVDGTGGNGPYVTFQKSGVSFGDIGDGSQMGGGYTANSLAFTARLGSALQLGVNGNSAPSLSISTAGNVTINAPGSGDTLVVNALATGGIGVVGSTNPLIYTSSAGSIQTALQSIDAASSGWVGTVSAHDFRIATSNSTRILTSAAGNVSINSPSSGYPLYVEGDVRAHLPNASNSTFRGYDFGIIGATTSYGNIGQNITTGEMRYRAGFSGWGGIHTFYTDGAERFWITALGNVGINAPTGGVPLTVTTSPSQVSQSWVDGTGTAQVQQSSGDTYFGTISAHDLRLMTSNTVRGTISAAGNWTIAAPSSGLALTAIGFANNFAITASGASASGQSRGLRIVAGTTSADYSLLVNNYANTLDHFTIFGDGGVTAGTPTGGNKGAGTLNTAGQIYINNAEVGFKDVPRAVSTFFKGECTALNAGATLNTGYAAGTCFSIYNDSASAITLTQGGGLTLRLAGTATTGSRTLAARGMATVWANSTTEYIITGAGVT